MLWKTKLKAVASSPPADPGGGLHCLLSLHWALLVNGQPHCRLCCISAEMTLPVCSFCRAQSAGWRQDHYQHPAAGRFCSLSDQLTWHKAIFTVREQWQPYLHCALLTLFWLWNVARLQCFIVQGWFWIAKGTERVLRGWGANQVWCTQKLWILQVFHKSFAGISQVTILSDDRKTQQNAEKWQLIYVTQETFILGACPSEFHWFHSAGKVLQERSG